MSTHTHDHYDVEEDSHEQNQEHPRGVRGAVGGLLNPHSHEHSNLAADSAFADNEAGIRTVWLALAILTVTSILQMMIVYASGSMALLGDTAHNIGDGLNSVPLLIAFYLARRAATSRYRYGYGRAEDMAGIFIVVSLLISAGIVFWESVQRLLDPQPIESLGWVAAAAVIGFLGNEFVAVLQISVGKRIGSAALVADGLHARTDGLTSLAVLPAAAGSWLGYPLADPIIGLLIGAAILFITWDAGKRIWYRLMDAVEPGLAARVETAVLAQVEVQEVERLRLRWIGHELQGDIRLSLSPGVDTAVAKQDIRHAAQHAAPKLTDLAVDVIGNPTLQQAVSSDFLC